MVAEKPLKIANMLPARRHAARAEWTVLPLDADMVEGEELPGSRKCKHLPATMKASVIPPHTLLE